MLPAVECNTQVHELCNFSSRVALIAKQAQKVNYVSITSSTFHVYLPRLHPPGGVYGARTPILEREPVRGEKIINDQHLGTDGQQHYLLGEKGHQNGKKSTQRINV